MRVIVCGGRHFGVVPNIVPPELLESARVQAAREKAVVFDALDSYPIVELSHGDADGADRCARDWCALRRVVCRAFPAQWALRGKAAGPLRNQWMLDDVKPDAVIAFPGGKGTADMVRRAKAAGVRVIEVEEARDDG